MPGLRGSQCLWRARQLDLLHNLRNIRVKESQAPGLSVSYYIRLRHIKAHAVRVRKTYNVRGRLEDNGGSEGLSLKHWQTYYRTGALATCPTSPDGAYDHELYNVWDEFFSTQSDGARILDIGTGNGAVALIAKETAARVGRCFEIHGTDLAMIDPKQYVPDGARRLADIEFHGGIATESLPFEDGYFDAVSGQYALEYMQLDEALKEIHRVLKSTGRARFIVHHADSVIVQNARESLDQANVILKETGIYRLLRRYLAADRKSSPNTPHHLDQLMTAGDRLKHAAAGARSTVYLNATLDALQRLVNARHHMTQPALEQEVDRVEGELRAAVQRLKDLDAGACNEHDLKTIEDYASNAGLRLIEQSVQRHKGNNLVGWRLEFAPDSINRDF